MYLHISLLIRHKLQNLKHIVDSLKQRKQNRKKSNLNQLNLCMIGKNYDKTRYQIEQIQFLNKKYQYQYIYLQRRKSILSLQKQYSASPSNELPLLLQHGIYNLAQLDLLNQNETGFKLSSQKETQTLDSFI
ncbi:hypothetical protein TTHERM_000059525 (macronuclear) [Tetrahymena thermophila SB210]|uniref:Uncharacterized protein n=1 Tax=Tetrahymena thermophila (strain SB210) TaxID=312017 RepID=W7XFA0_TETTS|nr:hypothetical protein TTHERM_000059525 [Tetrahymena thermophila SB210]EWS76482.1 hypothetical protein TTHERM_000059525 [Tetrahymena thermophila SB210]|eukprot:XP_012650982.1 hypothetical protein TTHERM_000059525 [Tetrahymena thermophila SB210]